MEPNNFGNAKAPFWVSLVLGIFRIWLLIYDCLALLPFAIFANPRQKIKRSQRVKARPLIAGDYSSPLRNINCDDSLCCSIYDDITRLDQLWDRSVLMHWFFPCMGTRHLVNVEQEKQPNGRVFEKLIFGDYEWLTYQEVNEKVKNFSRALFDVGQKPYQNLVIFAETRAEWMITALACFKLNVPVVTVYATLGKEAIIHAINETKSVTAVCSPELLPLLKQVIESCPTLQRLVYFHSSNTDVTSAINDSPISILSFSQMEENGRELESYPETSKDGTDLALIIYTSGTTDLPKGVMVSHYNIISSTTGQSAAIPNLGPSDVYLGYLPLAHILEFGAEFSCLIHGASIGYSSPLTMHDRASKIKRGTKGDCSVLRPTLVAAVPAIMDRIYKAVADEVSCSSDFMKAMFHMMYERKRKKLEEGYDNPFLNRLVYKRIRGILGGHVRMMLSGGAPLSAETQRFMNICFCCPVGQGYGLTETCGAGTICDAEDLLTGRVGPPLICNDIMLRDWVEGNYTVHSKPYPQGEILFSGGNVAKGYWKLPEKTAEVFIEIDGRRWFCSGDIGEIQEDGSLKIIDRKKYLVKLSHGEYVSLGKVETTLLTNPLFENICVYGNSLHSYTVALLVPSRKHLEEIGRKLGLSTDDYSDLCANELVKKVVFDKMVAYGLEAKLEKGEIPAKIHICPEVWTPAMGLLTEAYKLKRKPIELYYKSELEKLYQ